MMLQGPLPPPVDPNFLATQIIPLIGGIAALFVGAFVFRWFFHSPIADAIAEGIRERRRRRHWKGFGGEWTDEPSAEVAGAAQARVVELEERVAGLQSQVAELAERLDFAERVLAERREHRLGAGT